MGQNVSSGDKCVSNGRADGTFFSAPELHRRQRIEPRRRPIASSDLQAPSTRLIAAQRAIAKSPIMTSM
jgi:hypothetical protein